MSIRKNDHYFIDISPLGGITLSALCAVTELLLFADVFDENRDNDCIDTASLVA